jgi:hypothetical protein
MPAQQGACSVYVTRREAEVLSLLAQGFANEEIGVTLGLETDRYTATTGIFIACATELRIPDEKPRRALTIGGAGARPQDCRNSDRNTIDFSLDSLVARRPQLARNCPLRYRMHHPLD